MLFSLKQFSLLDVPGCCWRGCCGEMQLPSLLILQVLSGQEKQAQGMRGEMWGDFSGWDTISSVLA